MAKHTNQLDIPKFYGWLGDDPSNHMMTFNLWCSSNSLVDDSIRLRLLQRTLMGIAAKWYIELSRNTFTDFSSLTMVFLTHFQLPILYGLGTKILNLLKQFTSTHICLIIYTSEEDTELLLKKIPRSIISRMVCENTIVYYYQIFSYVKIHY